MSVCIRVPERLWILRRNEGKIDELLSPHSSGEVRDFKYVRNIADVRLWQTVWEKVERRQRARVGVQSCRCEQVLRDTFTEYLTKT